VDFKNTIIIFTSNIGSQEILELGGTPDSETEMRQRVMEQMRRKFRPEFLNRLDEYIIFSGLTKRDLRGIVRQQVCFFLPFASSPPLSQSLKHQTML
jgi:ATP-dependent Clp protease ATP-binding subunit ClpB